MTIDEAFLDERLAEVERARPWSPRLVSKLEALLHAADESSLYRMNPLAFARDKGVSTLEAIDLFLHAAKAGILTVEWHLLCPACGIAVESFASLRTLHADFFCGLCRIGHEASLDDYIQVSFTVAPRVRRLSAHDPDKLSAEQYVKLRFTREARVGSVDGPSFGEAMAPFFAGGYAWLLPRSEARVTLERGAGALMFGEINTHVGAQLMLEPGAEPRPARLVMADSGMSVEPETVAPGRVEITIDNRTDVRGVLITSYVPTEYLNDRTGVVFQPFLSGGMLLTNQTFRRLFRSEIIVGTEGLGVRDVTVLFTDLKGSTALYERIGDLKAFSLVQQHFERLAAVVQVHAGALIKTIGDAVMAAFQRPTDAVRAARQMQQEIDEFNGEHGARDIVLKIGIHRGPSIAVTLNDSLDYFGQTVNVAARVQGLADADEIYLTDEVYQSEGVKELLAGLDVSPQDARLRGLQKEFRVHRAARAPARQVG